MRFAALRRLGLRKTAVGLTPFVVFFSATFLRLLERFAFLYHNRKTSHTAGTLCAIGFVIKQNYKKNNKITY
jgi:hypothetical protein